MLGKEEVCANCSKYGDKCLGWLPWNLLTPDPKVTWCLWHSSISITPLESSTYASHK